MLDKQIHDLELLRGHLLNHIPTVGDMKECFIFRNEQDRINAIKLLELLNYILATIENSDNIREVSKVIDLDVLENRFDYIMKDLSKVNQKHSDIVDAIVRKEEEGMEE